MRTLLIFLLFCIVVISKAADAKPTPADFLSLYTIVPDDAFNRQFGKNFEYELAIPNDGGAKTVKGIYKGKPVLTLEHIEKVGIETREIMAAPFSGLRFVLNEAGVRVLREYLRQPDPKDMVVFIDGHVYATLTLDIIRDMAEHRVMFIILPGPQASTAYHFLQLLADKLKAAISNK